MRSYVSIGDTAEANLTSAILIYELQKGGACATVHDIITTKGVPSVGPGVPVTDVFLKSLAVNLAGNIVPEILPENVLARTPAVTIWWTPARRKMMRFGGTAKESPELEKMSGQTFAQPPLLWIVEGRRLRIRALASCERPTDKTPTFVAPFWNTEGVEGTVCQGSMRSPDNSSIDSLLVWEKAFYESLFTHQSGGKKLSRHPDGFVGTWRDNRTAERFDTALLVPVKGETVGSIVRGNRAQN
jgi:PRTRC genetic system protein B